MIVRCPDCGSKGRLSDEFADQTVRCPQCGVKFVADNATIVPPEVKWFYAEGQEKMGPVGQDEFERLIGSGTIAPDTLVWRKGLAGWQSLSDVQGNEQTLTVAQEDLPFSQSPEDTEILAGPGFGRSEAGVATGGVRLTYGGGGKRLGAKIIDLIFMFTLASMVEGLSRKLFPGAYASVDISSVYAATMAINMLLGISYITWFIGKFGATPGKMVFNLKVVTPTGGRVGYGQAFGRYCGEFIVIWLTLLLGYLPIFFDAQKRGLHDRLCATRVVVV